MFLAYQVGAYYKDLSDERFDLGAGPGAPAFLDQHLPVLEARPPLPDGRAQRRDQHAARQRQLDGGPPGVGLSPLFGDDIEKLWPISYEGQSDTACFDNALEFLVMGGYSLAHAVMMLIPEAWAGNR
jgi:glutamate synthase (NADPH/NADH) large chain